MAAGFGKDLVYRLFVQILNKSKFYKEFIVEGKVTIPSIHCPNIRLQKSGNMTAKDSCKEIQTVSQPKLIP
jgi:hypothetical protein